MISVWLGVACLILGVALFLWWLISWLFFRRVSRLLNRRIHLKYLRTNFDAIGMSSPYIDFYFNAHNCLSAELRVTGEHKGNLYHYPVEFWRSAWEIESEKDGAITQDDDTEIRIRWVVPTSHIGPMAELAFKATGNPPTISFNFDDMAIELECKFLKLKSTVGWLNPSISNIDIELPNHPRFDRVRKGYNIIEGNE